MGGRRSRGGRDNDDPRLSGEQGRTIRQAGLVDGVGVDQATPDIDLGHAIAPSLRTSPQ